MKLQQSLAAMLLAGAAMTCHADAGEAQPAAACNRAAMEQAQTSVAAIPDYAGTNQDSEALSDPRAEAAAAD